MLQLWGRLEEEEEEEEADRFQHGPPAGWALTACSSSHRPQG